jgi:hypothetical protein
MVLAGLMQLQNWQFFSSLFITKSAATLLQKAASLDF